MTAKTPLGDIDILHDSDLRMLGERGTGPCVSTFLPTHRHGPGTRQGPIRLRNLADEATRQLREGGVPKAVIEEVLNPLRTLEGDTVFWQHQADGLALFSAPGRFLSLRVPLTLPEEVSVAASFRIRPLVPLLSGDGSFFVLALSQNSVRLFEATRSSIGELDRGPVPGSIDEALAHEDRERELQVRASGGGEVMFHGHGAGGEVDKLELERFFRAVDAGVVERLGAVHRPLVLACVGYYGPIYRGVTRYPEVIEHVVEGNPDKLRPEDLHAAAWPLVEPHFTESARAALERFQAAAGTGSTITAVEEIAARATEGRVDTLFVSNSVPVWGRFDPQTGAVTTSEAPSPDDDDLVDRAALDTLTAHGQVLSAPDDLAGEADPAAALLRY